MTQTKGTCNLIVNMCCAVKYYFCCDGVMLAGHFPSTREVCGSVPGFPQTKPKAYQAISLKSAMWD